MSLILAMPLEGIALAAPQDAIIVNVQGQAAPVAADPAPVAAVAAAETLPSGPLLHLKGGGLLVGEWKDGDDPQSIRWQSPAFREPFSFPMRNVASIDYPSAKEPEKPTGDFSFELIGGDLVFGTLLGINETEAEIETERFGTIHVARESLARVYRKQDGADLVYLGPNGLTGWKQADVPKDAWREESGQLVTDQEGASIRAEIGIPDKAAVEFSVGWTTKPDFDFAFGATAQAKGKDSAFHFEVWDGNIVVQRETDKEADVESILEVGKLPKSGEASFVAYIDQTAGRIVVYSLNGRKLAELKVGSNAPVVNPSVSLTNKRGDLRLQRLKINRWNGDLPREAVADRSRIHLNDGSILYGKILSYEPRLKTFSIAVEKDGEKTEETEVGAEKVQSLFLTSKGDEKPRSIRVLDRSGVRLNGELVKVENGKVVLDVPGIKEKMSVAIDRLNTVTPLVVAEPVKSPRNGAIGFLQVDGARIEGQLVDAAEKADASCLSWKPLLSDSACSLKPGTAGSINYRVVSAAKLSEKPGTQPQVAQPRGLANLRGLSAAMGTKPAGGLAPTPRNLYLRTGDVIPCIITKIDENGLNFKTALSDSTFVGHDKVKAVELGIEPPMTPRITKTKRDRLLMLPRMQKDSPPLQLVRSLTGDYLRGRVVQLDDQSLQIETRLETKTIPRDRISKIIWLHPDETDPSKSAAKAAAEAKTTRVQAVRSDGVRLTFLAESVADAVLIGKSDVLGICRVAVKDVDQILIGDQIEKTAAQLAYQQWKLQNAPEPKSADPSGSESARSESPLVGKPAPPFSLDLLDGSKFNVADRKGKVVILDFWATWCGPCLQAMPQVERVAEEFKNQGVELVAVNLQESPAQIKSLMERQNLKMTVALDVNGAVAEKYEANAIPQTVIIDRNGNIAQLFVGGGAHFDDTLRTALKEVLGTTDPKPEDKK